MMKINVYSVDCRPTEPLHVMAVRYRPNTVLPPGGVTLILTHALGLHKVRAGLYLPWHTRLFRYV